MSSFFCRIASAGILQNLHHARQELQHHVPLAAREATVEDLQFLDGQSCRGHADKDKSMKHARAGMAHVAKAGTVRNLRGVPLIVLAAHLLEAGLHPWVLLQPADQGPPTTALKYAGSAWAVCCDSQLKRAEQNRFHIVVHIHANRLYPEFCSLCRSYLTQPCSSLASTLLQSPNCTCPLPICVGAV